VRKRMPKRTSVDPLRCPPQLYGIYEDAVRLGAGMFWLERLPHAIMASFSAGNKAEEIDFEEAAGREMIDFLTRHLEGPKRLAGQVILEYGDHIVPCRVAVLPSRTSQRLQVSWVHEKHAKDA
jgi:hypothetical protein